MVRGDVQVEDFLQEFGALAPCLGRQGVAHLATEETPEGDCLGRTQLPVTADAHLEVTQEGQREEGRGAGLGSSARVGAAGAVEASEEEASSGCWGGPGGRAPGRIDAHNALDLQVAAHPVAASEDQPAALALRPALVAPLAPHLDLAAQQAGRVVGRAGGPAGERVQDGVGLAQAATLGASDRLALLEDAPEAEVGVLAVGALAIVHVGQRVEVG